MAIDKSYWENKEEIPISIEEKKKELDYEIKMFRDTIKAHRNNKINLENAENGQFIINLLVELLATHTRILVEFFYYFDKKVFPLRSKNKNKNHNDDIIAEDFILNWSEFVPPITDILIDAKNKSDKQLAHLSSWRKKLKDEGKNGWSFQKISNDMEIIIKKFEENYKN